MTVKRITRTTPRTVEQFMTALRGVPVRALITALDGLTLGVNWSGCSKSMIAENWARGYSHSRLDAVSLDDIHMALRMPANEIGEAWLDFIKRNKTADRGKLRYVFIAKMIAEHHLKADYVERCLRVRFGAR